MRGGEVGEGGEGRMRLGSREEVGVGRRGTEREKRVGRVGEKSRGEERKGVEKRG